MREYPLLFTTTCVVRGAGFTARILSLGKALMAHEDGAWWCHGVVPGGLTAPGKTPPEAYEAFKTAYREVLEDMADGGRDFYDFKRLAQEFFDSIDDVEEERWMAALQVLRIDPGKAEEPFEQLPREAAERPSQVIVEELTEFQTVEERLAVAGPKAA